MTEWNFDMSAAPKGRVRAVGELIPTGKMTWGANVPVFIIAADVHGWTCMSRWIPEEGCWMGFNKASPPIAWQPWPDHPEVGK